MTRQFWTRLFNRWNIYSPSQRTAIIAFVIMLVILPTTTILVQRSTENRSKAAEPSIPVTAPITNPNISTTPPIVTCTDSDGGKNYFIKGTTVGLAANDILTTRVDSCWPKNYYGDGYDYVAEWFCWTNPDNGKEYAINTNEKCLNGCYDGACVGTPSATLTVTPSIPIPSFKFALVNPAQTIKVGDVFTVNVFINTAGQKTLGGDAMILFDPSKLVVNPQQVRTGNFFDSFLSNTPSDPITKQKMNNKLIISGWQSMTTNPKYTYADSLYATMTIKAQAEGVSNISFECTSGTADSNIWNTDQTDIIKCPLQPLTVNIAGPTGVSPSITPAPAHITLPITVTPTPTSIPPLRITPTGIPFHPTSTPPQSHITSPPRISPTVVVFNKKIPTVTPRPLFNIQPPRNLITFFTNLFSLIFGKR